jgi:hypothetical protein
MISELITFVIVLALLFLVYRFVLVKVIGGGDAADADDAEYEDDGEDEHEAFEENRRPATVSFTGQKAPNLPDDRTVSPSGPNPPNVAGPVGEAVVMPPEQPFDPYAEHNQSAHVTDDTRNPQRMFRPAPEATDVNTAVAAGIAGTGATYSPEMVTNGAPFMDGVFAMDSSDASADSGFAPW